MIIVTGGAGFIGSAFIWKLNQEGINDILVVDTDPNPEKDKNLAARKFNRLIDKDVLLAELSDNSIAAQDVDAIVHMGACSDTMVDDREYMMGINFEYTKTLAHWALENDKRFIYASSAATYGDGSLGFSDADELTPKLCALNVYGESKILFDQWVLENNVTSLVVGLRFFNVYGPNEYHKNEMRSVIHKAWGQIREHGRVKLFNSYKDDYADGEQLRDFVYVKDCIECMWRLLQNTSVHGIFNIGTGKARSFKALVESTFAALGQKPEIEFIEMPETLRGKYQYFTEAEMSKLKQSGIAPEPTSLEDGIDDYVQNYLESEHPYL